MRNNIVKGVLDLQFETDPNNRYEKQYSKSVLDLQFETDPNNRHDNRCA